MYHTPFFRSKNPLIPRAPRIRQQGWLQPLLGVTGCFLVSLQLLQAQDVSVQEQLDALLSEYQQPDAPGIVVGVLEKGVTLYLKGFGVANLETRAPITPTTVFDVASLAKQFTGITIAMLAAEEALSLEDPITSHLEGLPDFCQTITVSQLLKHTSGIRDWPGLLVLGGLRLEDSITLKDIHSMVKNQRALNFPPDEESLYTNTGYNLLALIAERVTTDRFSDWTDQHLFTPLGMSNSFFHQSQGRIIKSLARSYAPSDRQKWTEIGNQLTAVGSSSLFTTVEDLLRWIQHFDTPTLLEAGDYYEDLLSKRPNETPESRYHWGLLEGTYEGKRQFHHGGAWAGFHTYLIYLPEQQLGVVALSNRTDIHIDAISYKILDVVSPPIEETKTPIIESAPRGPNTNPDEGLVWVGHYQSEGKEAHRIQFSRSNEAYRIKIDDQEPIPLAPIDQNHYHNEETALNVAFSTQHIGWPRRLKLTSSSLNTTVIETFDWPQDRNSEYDGTYYSKELKAEYRISTTKAGLTATHHRHGSINLTPTSKDRFISKTWFWKQSEFKRDRDDEIMGLEINQSRNRGILFTKRRSGSPTRD